MLTGRLRSQVAFGFRLVLRVRSARSVYVFVATNALPKWLEKPGPIVCTLLGAVADVTKACGAHFLHFIPKFPSIYVHQNAFKH